MCVWVRASQVLNLDLRGVLGLLVMVKLRDCLEGGVCLRRDWFEVMLGVSPEGVVFGRTYNERHVFYLADMLMQITLVIITREKRNKSKRSRCHRPHISFCQTTFMTSLATAPFLNRDLPESPNFMFTAHSKQHLIINQFTIMKYIR